MFQIGSITKIWTTTLVMQLIDEGAFALDTPVHEVLPDFTVADADAARTITVRHLLTHTSGIDGDFFEDTGRGDDCVERYVLACRALPQLHPPGSGFSYCNVGFTVAGRIVERHRGVNWDRALQECLAEPIGATALESLPERMAYYRCAVGHVRDGDAMRVAPRSFLPRSNGPAGATPFGTTGDLLALARLHLSGGVAPDGERLLSEGSVRQMQEEQVGLPPDAGGSFWGLGWKIFDWDGTRVIGHDGATIGQNAFLRIVPDRDLAVAVLTNSGDAAPLARNVFEHVLRPLGDVGPPAAVTPVRRPVDPAPLVGRYQRLAQRIEIGRRNDRLWATIDDRRPLLPGDARSFEAELHPVTDDLFAFTAPDAHEPTMLSFGDRDDHGRARWVSSSRRLPRIDDH